MYRLILRKGIHSKYEAKIQKYYFKRLWLTIQSQEVDSKKEAKQLFKTVTA